MSQYLAIGLNISMRISKAKMEKAQLDADGLCRELTNQRHLASDIYVRRETEGEFILELEEEILQRELVPFLEAFYPQVYPRMENYGYDRVLEKLKSTPPADWLRLGEDKEFYAFQADDCGRRIRFELDKPFRPSIEVVCDTILLSLEGKIMMEEFGRQFSFFQYCIRRAFSQFALAGAVCVYITG